jgi:hypothetical protein
MAGMTGLFPASFCWRRLSVAGSLADNARMAAIQSARKRIRGNFDTGNSPSRNDHELAHFSCDSDRMERVTSATFEGEFCDATSSHAGKGVLRSQ